jgi:hypothetical protein
MGLPDSQSRDALPIVLLEITMSDIRHRSLGVNYLGFLNAKLRDLKGFDVLAQELIQNADDAKGGNEDEGARAATKVVFDIRDDALVVSNDGHFTDCGEHDLDPDQCPWQHSKGNRCDLHRFRETASGDKRNEEGTTGNFGIGFIAVYQITDAPELRTKNLHWVISPEKSQDERITERDCDPPYDGTEFRLPWAFHGSYVRQQLKVPQITLNNLDEFAEKIAHVLPFAGLFLNRLTELEVRRNGIRKSIVSIDDSFNENNNLNITIDGTTTKWTLFHGNFDNKEKILRDKFGNNIEKKKHSKVTVAIPQPDKNIDGILCATLPTHKKTGLPFLINADFFPTTDRLDVRFQENDPQGDWNRAAIEAAAVIFTNSLPLLKESHGAAWIWNSADAAKKVSLTKDVFSTFWASMLPSLKSGEYVWLAQGIWRTPQGAYQLESKDQLEARTQLLVNGSFPIVALELRNHFPLLREIGVKNLGPIELTTELRHRGMSKYLSFLDIPEWISDIDSQEILGDLILSYAPVVDNQWTLANEHRSSLRTCSIARTCDSGLGLPSEIFNSSSQYERDLFHKLPLGISFVDPKAPKSIRMLCQPLKREIVLKRLESHLNSEIVTFWQENNGHWIELLKWLNDIPIEEWEKRKDILSSLIRRTPIWPSGNSLYPLEDLAIPGGFDDWLQIAKFLDKSAIEVTARLFELINIERLNIIKYIIIHVPKYFDESPIIDPDVCELLLHLFSDHLLEIRGHNAAQAALSKIPIIRCLDGILRQPTEIYFDTDIIRQIFQVNFPIISRPQNDSLYDLLKLIGVSEQPRSKNIINLITETIKKPPYGHNRSKMRSIIITLGRYWEHFPNKLDFMQLKNVSWLPAKGVENHWLKPSDIRSSYEEGLFASQDKFLDIPPIDQARSRVLFEYLGITFTPSTNQIVSHLLHCIAEDLIPDSRIYSTLTNRLRGNSQTEESRELTERAINRLKNESCISIHEGYVKPTEVFWNPTLYGKYAPTLDRSFGEYKSLLDFLGVKTDPENNDILRIINTVSTEFHSKKCPDTVAAILENCWRFLQQSLFSEVSLNLETIRGKRIIYSSSGFLLPPSEIVFEDRAGLADSLGDNVRRYLIPRREDTWQILKQLGVKMLSECIRSEINDISGDYDDDLLLKQIQERIPLMRRVIANQVENKYDWDIQKLDKMRLMRFQSLIVLRMVYLNGGIISNTSDEPTVFYYPKDNCLFIHKEEINWMQIARELLIAINPSADPSHTFALSAIFSAQNIDNAQVVLDQAGIARLEESDSTLNVSPQTADLRTTDTQKDEMSVFQTESSPDYGDLSSVKTDISSDENNSNNFSSVVIASDSVPTSLSSDLDTFNIAEPDLQQRTASFPTRTFSDSTASSRVFQSTPKKQGSALHSYVAPNEKNDVSKDASEGLEEHRSEVEQLGVKAAMEYETTRGRFPKEMPTNHPGYDIESRASGSSTASVERYIEVKTIPQEWGQRGVSMSDTQFDKARSLGDRYWLYVVENAHDKPQVIPIQNPVDRVDKFFFDEGWRGTANEEPPRSQPSIRDLILTSEADGTEDNLEDLEL